MKRKFGMLMLSVLLSISLGINAEAKTENAGATYTKETPVIDGKIDGVWGNAVKLYSDVGKKEENAYGVARILWTEKALYFLVEVEDATIFSNVEGNLSEGVMLMVSGKSEEEWCYFVNVGNETILDSATTEMFEEATCVVKPSENKYVVEIALPVNKAQSYAKGDYIGFNFYVLDDVNGDYSLDHICSWQDSGMENVTVWEREGMAELAKIEFVMGETGPQVLGAKTKVALGVVFGVVVVISFILWRSKRRR